MSVAYFYDSITRLQQAASASYPAYFLIAAHRQSLVRFWRKAELGRPIITDQRPDIECQHTYGEDYSEG